ncbi:hypothetical protein DE4585_02130 [Mycobacteroides salmoniphilum]|uniref:SHOCT domain-containing protein n=2 Tax=Mycobacteroides salmoniphilum TaxID=404941 RepID=A0A4R8S2E6_9MYCO|nr:hypothetical protein DE4586_03642 [Mycobacteroides salmoniphilum]TDZ83335.1 hypothetical protein DE4585_02130 [Mycobacteroides salmoniphilum]TDZ84268.1 hypothetical protein DE4587_03184 [Mycobacteroides salmoniphilum]
MPRSWWMMNAMNVVARFLKILAFSLLCGIVGPIFIVMYYVIDQPATSWMLYSGVGITIGIVVLAFVLTLIFTRTDEARKLLEANGVLALADVVAANETGMRVNDQPVIKLTLQIHGDGISPFRAETRTRVSVLQVPALSRGVLVVLVAPGTEQFQIDWQRSALLNGQVPAKFTSSSQGREYDLTGQAGPLFEIMKVLKANGIGTDGVVDIRSNPVVRQQIDAILRKTEGAERTPSADLTPTGSVADRLAELDRLKLASLVSEAEYNTKRAEILGDL